MDTQNVSAQLYLKQLPSDPQSGSFNCGDAYPNLSTCVNNVATDAQIENAFQDQLDLSLIYKSPEIFNKVKSQYMDKTMEAENTPVSTIKSQPIPPSVPLKKRVGSTDFLRAYTREGFTNSPSAYIREGFGYTSNCMLMVVLALVAVIVAIYLFNKKILF